MLWTKGDSTWSWRLRRTRAGGTRLVTRLQARHEWRRPTVAGAIAGLFPRWTLLAWSGVAFVIFQVMLGERLRLPDWLDAISPFWHLPGVPVEAFAPLPGLAELALTAVLVLLGQWGYRRRDLAAV